jgi:hypothetical protein
MILHGINCGGCCSCYVIIIGVNVHDGVADAAVMLMLLTVMILMQSL